MSLGMEGQLSPDDVAEDDVNDEQLCEACGSAEEVDRYQLCLFCMCQAVMDANGR